MKKLKQMSGPYSIGFELSSTAHGFVATDPNGNVLYHGKQPVMGTRVFKEGQHAAEARMPRTSRRGIQRRRGREHEMERVFAPVISSIDPDFFIRRRMSYKLGKIRFESDPIGFSYSRLFHSFPTLAHLDVALMEADSAMDPRLIFEAVANHVVRRGHFLLENQNVSSTNSDIDTQVANYAEVLVSYFEDTLDERIELSLEALDINGNVTARELQKQFASAMCVSGDDIQKKTEKAQIKAIADLVAGYKADLTVLVPDAEKLPKVSISDGDALEEFLADSCPDSLVPVLMAAQALYTSWKLQGMLSYAPGKSLSHNQVAQHDVYGKQLRMLKDLALKYVAKQDANGNVDEDGFKDYVRFFGGPKREDGYRYDKVQVKKQDSPKNNMGYTAYNLNVLGYEEFAKRVELLFKDTDAVDDSQYKTMMEAFANHAFLRRIHTVDNAAIPYQLHAEVVNRIIDNQGRFYPWLIDAREHILKVLTSRIPYYVGPLDSTDHGKAGENGTRFAWVKRLAGHEDAFVSPWNYEDHIDIDTTAELFIRRMTGECSYLDGEDVLAKNSLLYEKYCFFNELASLSFTEDGDSWMPFDAGMRRAIYDAASDGKTMTVKRIESVLQRDFFIAHPHVRGTSNPKAMSSKRSNYAYFCRLFDVKALSASDMSMAEDLVLWNTVFEDRDILRRKILKTYGDLLTEKAVDDFCHKRLSGWGKLSERLLTGIWADTASGDLCVMDVLEQGRPYGRYRGSSMNLMQILNDDALGFKMEIKRLNDSHMQMAEGFDLNALPGSPALRRGVSQAMKVLDDIVSVAGKAPDRIYLKVTRTASNSRKGKRTAKRSDKIKLALKALDADAAADLGAAKLLRELGMFDEKEINERIYLYFHQAGKCLYTGKPIDITRIASNDYYVDHVVPLAYRKDESLDNKVLVYAEASRYKSETLLVSPAVQRKMLPFWRMLRNAGLMSERKLNALIRTEISEGMLKSIIGRQFTENSWEAKLFTAAIAAKYPGTVVIPVKAGVIGAVRSRIGIPKSLKANQFYHAHDALLAAEVGRYMELAKPAFVHNRVKYEQYMRKIKLVDEENKKAPKSQLDFFAGGFFFDRVDKDTGEVYWDKDEEVERIYRACGWKNLRVTYAAFEDGGAFWKQTIYSPREKSKLIATKSDRPAEIYGGYSSQTFANFFVYEVMKKKVKQLRFGAVPAAIASKSDPDTYNAMLEMYARGLAKTAKEKFVRIVRARVLKNTMIELYGERFRIAGEKQVYPVRQMPLAIDEVYLLKGVEAIAAAGNAGASARIDFEKAAESLVGFWDLLLEKLPVNYPKLTAQLKLGSLKHPKDILAATSESEFPAIVYKIAEAEIQVMEQASGLRNMSDTKILGGNTFGGSLVFTFNKVLNDPKSKACFIDTTPAGLHEVKTKIW